MRTIEKTPKSKTTTTDRIQVTFPPAMKEFITELCGTCQITFKDFERGCLELLESEVTETFADHPCAGILDYIAAFYGEEVARMPGVRQVIEKHRGKFSIMKR